MKKIPFIYIIFSLLITLGACNEPVFYTIQTQPPKIEPFIGGGPTNFVTFSSKIYVASGNSIYSYDGSAKKWEKIPVQPGGWIMGLAVTSGNLYALCLNSNNTTTLRKSSTGTGNWGDVTGDRGVYDRLQSVYSANNMVFIGAGSTQGNSTTTQKTAVLSISGDTTYAPLTGISESHRLNGVANAGTNYFLSTDSNTIYLYTSGTTASAITKGDVSFAGIINIVGSNVLAISRSGNLYPVSSSAIGDSVASFGSRFSSGALAVWSDNPATPTHRLLLAGRQDSLTYSTTSGYTYGYLELELDSGGTNGIKTDANFLVPGNTTADFSSVNNHERYVSTIGKYPVNHLIQASNGIIFASTQKNGVWSYKVRDGIPQWNAETND
jgi:hypothetical protein